VYVWKGYHPSFEPIWRLLSRYNLTMGWRFWTNISELFDWINVSSFHHIECNLQHFIYQNSIFCKNLNCSTYYHISIFARNGFCSSPHTFSSPLVYLTTKSKAQAKWFAKFKQVTCHCQFLSLMNTSFPSEAARIAVEGTFLPWGIPPIAVLCCKIKPKWVFFDFLIQRPTSSYGILIIINVISIIQTYLIILRLKFLMYFLKQQQYAIRCVH